MQQQRARRICWESDLPGWVRPEAKRQHVTTDAAAGSLHGGTKRREQTRAWEGSLALAGGSAGEELAPAQQSTSYRAFALFAWEV